ncbi:MAG: hypothetical protein L0211_03760 [Planctomycetaceae bacterium]|nr:hypothetical protein [Planctomycetaceae bacterium]
MHSLWLYTLIALGAGSENTQLESGSLIFLENVSSVVEFSTRGKIGHVALAFRDGSDTWIYEATPGKVRRVAAADYFAELARLNKRRDADDQMTAWLLKPKQPYTEDEIGKMREFLDGQIGRRYSLRNYVRGKSDGAHTAEIGPVTIEVVLNVEEKPGDGIHCAELASTTLSRTGRYDFKEFHKIHPQALYTVLLPTHFEPAQISVPQPVGKESWCLRAQRRCGEWWTWCGWSCGEAWSLCW